MSTQPSGWNDIYADGQATQLSELSGGSTVPAGWAEDSSVWDGNSNAWAEAPDLAGQISEIGETAGAAPLPTFIPDLSEASAVGISKVD